MDSCDKPKTAFVTRRGLFEVLPFGLCVVPAERLMETILAGLHWQTCLMYLDDIIVICKNFDDHLKHLKEIFCRLQEQGLKLTRTILPVL